MSSNSFEERKVDCPYPGLRPFESHESSIFFGRGRQVRQMIERLQGRRFLAVVGASGSGKSSLVRAGLLPVIRDGFLLDEVGDWTIVTMLPRGTPFLNLAKEISRRSQDTSPGFLEATLRGSDDGIAAAFAEVGFGQGAPILLLVDQFEEIFRYDAALGREDMVQTRNDAALFVSRLLQATKSQNARIYVILTMRSDFMGRCDQFEGLPEAINDGQFLTPRLTYDQLREAIVGPAGLFGLRIEESLITRLLNDAGGEPDMLPLVQHLLRRLWTLSSADRDKGVNVIGLQLYEAPRIQGLEKALTLHGEEIWAELQGEAIGRRTFKDIAKRMFQILCSGWDEKRDVRRPSSVSSLAKIIGFASEGDVIRVASYFQDPECSFLVRPRETAGADCTVLDITHESLIRKWADLGLWVAEESQSRKSLQRLSESAGQRRLGQAELLTGLDLEFYRGFFSQQPTSAWAEIYGCDLEVAAAFYHESKLAQQQRLEEQETRKADETRRSAALEHIRPEERPTRETRSGYTYRYDVFLSYKRPDASRVRDIAHRLRMEGLRVFFDEWEITPGSDWRIAIEEAMSGARTAVLSVGPSGVSESQLIEIRHLQNRMVQESDFRLIPVLLPGASPNEMPAGLRRLQWVEFTGGSEDHNATRKLIVAIRGEFTAQVDDSLSLPDQPAPYRGLAAFDSGSAPLIFGRDGEIRDLAEMLKSPGLVVVVGVSGAGKISLILAGLMTEVAERALPGIKGWERLVIRPGTDPLAAVQTASEKIARLVPSRRILLIVDQLEELFHQSTSPETPKAFFHSLGSIANTYLSLRVILSLRSDLYGEWTSLPVSGTARTLPLGPLTSSGLREAVVRPAQMVGAYFEEGLVDRILADISIAQQNSLPILQMLLHELWVRRRGPWLTHAAYSEIGGAANALTSIAERVYGSFDHKEREIADALFLRLTSVGDERVVARRADFESLRANPSLLGKVIERLASENLLTVQGEFFQWTHDVVPRSWGRIGHLVAAERIWLSILRDVRNAYTEWESEKKNPRLLLTGWQLERATRLRFEKPTLLSHGENEFVFLSLRKRRMIHQSCVVILVLFVACIGILLNVIHVKSTQIEIIKLKNRQLEELLLSRG